MAEPPGQPPTLRRNAAVVPRYPSSNSLDAILKESGMPSE
jgi:hypothetical protein